MAYLIICFFFGLAGGYVGRVKGSSFVLWFLISALIPVLALVGTAKTAGQDICSVKGRDRNTDPGRTRPVSAGAVVPGSDSTIAAYAPRAPPTRGDTTVCRRVQQLDSITVARRHCRELLLIAQTAT